MEHLFQFFGEVGTVVVFSSSFLTVGFMLGKWSALRELQRKVRGTNHRGRFL